MHLNANCNKISKNVKEIVTTILAITRAKRSRAFTVTLQIGILPAIRVRRVKRRAHSSLYGNCKLYVHVWGYRVRTVSEALVAIKHR